MQEYMSDFVKQREPENIIPFVPSLICMQASAVYQRVEPPTGAFKDKGYIQSYTGFGT